MTVENAPLEDIGRVATGLLTSLSHAVFIQLLGEKDQLTFPYPG